MTVREAPLSRGLVDELLPWLRAALGILFVGYSANSTVFICGSDLAWLFPATAKVTIAVFADALWYSTALAVILFVGEVCCGERYVRTYWIFLVPDAFYTVRGMWWSLCRAMIVLFGAKIGDGSYSELLGYLIGTIVAIVVGFLVAKWGEVLLFGKRRKTRRSAKE